MTSWRDTASQEAQDDLDDLTGVALDFATEQLSKQGVLAPFAVVRETGGDVRLVALDDDVDTKTLVDLIVQAVRSEREDLRAAAFVADITAEELGGDAVRVLVEHRDGVALAVYQPYEETEDELILGDLSAGAGTALVWPAA